MGINRVPYAHQIGGLMRAMPSCFVLMLAFGCAGTEKRVDTIGSDAPISDTGVSAPPECGNGVTEAGEDCDDAGESVDCDSD